MAVLPGFAATSSTWEVNGFSELLKGRLAGLSLTADGRLMPGPAIQEQVAVNQPAVWSMVAGPNGSVFAASGHQGKIFEIDPRGKLTEVWNTPEPEVFALAVGTKGELFAATSPNGAVYRISGGKGIEVWRSGTKYIWSLAVAKDGSLYVGTGDGGKIFLVHPNGTADLFYETGQMNVTALAINDNGHLLAGTDPNGLLYDISGRGKATVLYDSNLPEFRSIAIAPDGTIYAAAMGGAVSTRNGTAPPSTPVTSTPAVSAAPTVITVSEASGNAVDQQATAPPASQSPSGTSTSATQAGASTGAVEVSGVEKSAIYRISRDGAVQTLWTSKDDNAYDLVLDGGTVLFSTDVEGHIYRLDGSQVTLVAELADGETTRIVQNAGMLFAAMSNPGRVFVLGSAASKGATYESTVHDSVSVARWGHIRWHANGTDVAFRTRTGYSIRPDGTWSDWSAPVADPSKASIMSPPARFIQWKAEWPAGSTAQLDTVDVPYLPQNGSPAVHSVTVISVLNSNPSKSATTAASSSAAYSVTVTDTGQPPAATSGSSASQSVSHLQSTQTQISWQADDPDGDKLAYSVYFRAEDETGWQLVRSRMFENTLLLDPDVFADGRYYFKVVANDAPTNDQEFAKQAELVSAPVLIDNTPPVVIIGTPKHSGESVDVDVTGEDSTSPLRVCEYSLDAGSWQPIEAVDGVTDSPREQFHLHLDRIRPGEHLLVFRVYDVANNAGLARIILR